IPADEELKWKPAKGTFLRGANGELVADLRQSMLDAALKCDIRPAVVVVDQGRVFREKTAAGAGKEIVKYLYERIEMCLDDNKDIGVVIADEPGGGAKAERRWLADTLELTKNGTQYVRAERVVMPIVTAPSDHVPHLQLADLVTAATTAAVAGRKSGLDLVSRLKALAHKRKSGETGGAGIVLWPPDLYDLHWWVFGETHYIRGNSGTPLGPNHTSKIVPIGRPFIRHD